MTGLEVRGRDGRLVEPVVVPRPAAAVDPAPDVVVADGSEPAGAGRTTTRSGRRGRSLRSITNRGFAVFTALKLAAVVSIVVALVRLLHATDDQTLHYGPAAIRANAVVAALLDQETGVRGYAITGDPSYLQPYTDGLAAMTTAAGQVRGYLKAGDDAARGQLAAALQAADAWRAQFAEPLIAATRSEDRASATALLEASSATGKELFDTVRARTATLSTTLTDLRAGAVAQVRSSAALLEVMVIVGFAVVLLASASVYTMVRRRVIAPIQRLGAGSRRVTAGELDHRIPPGGAAEIDDLAQDVEAMRLRVVTELAEVAAAREAADRTSASLARSNADLEQFAYVASHDLQEPLRKVSNFCQLLERQYGPQLDDRAGQYIHFAVDGAKRMQVLINDLLSFSRVGRNADSFVPVDLAEVVREAVDNLSEPVRDTGATVVVAADLPTVPADRTLLVTLLQNLVSNSLKYHGEELPHVEIDAVRREVRDPLANGGPVRHEWVVSVADNGIGIDAQYAQRIFVIFQRLHLRDSYGGTGIGLAMCKKIVEFHGGTIWLDDRWRADRPGRPGSRFCFTLPEGTPQ